MQVLSLLQQPLKSDVVIELLDVTDAKVIYDFDRLKENLPDQYWVSIREHGVQLCFDEFQVCHTIFVYTREADDFRPVDRSVLDIPCFEARSEAKGWACSQGLRIEQGQVELFGVSRDRLKVFRNSYSVHDEFHDGQLYLITLAST
ncbi:MAG: hypothetical protein ACE37H_15070 [Phycisphaeraceae bacterium]